MADESDKAYRDPPLTWCPCCGLPGVTGEDDICVYCDWQWWGDDRAFPDAPSAPNGSVTLRTYQNEIPWIDEVGNGPVITIEGETVPRDPTWRRLPRPFDGWPVVDPDLPLSNATCTCCGYKTIHGGRAQCAICGWKCLAIQFDFRLLEPAQRNYRTFGACDLRLVGKCRAPNRTDQFDATWRPCPSALGDFDIHKSRLLPVTCPCCGLLSVDVSGDCLVCGWRYFLGHRNPADHSQPNPISLRKAQENYRRIGIWSPGVDENGKPFRSYEPPDQFERDPEWRPLE